MSAVFKSWDVDDWLESLGIDPDCNVLLEQVGASWGLTVVIPAGEDPDEYLCGLEAHWQDRFGEEPVVFKAYKPAHTKSTGPLNVAALAAAAKALAEAFGYPMPIGYGLKGLVSTAAVLAPPVPKHLLQAKGPRNKWGGAKGARAR